ncbi:uncharacterized protein LOC132384523 [Hypanus sabinus]|uniref:uncharacterized protein LOC132384523 n=1 Tax=Hypanus sabinus TaxID=79690 RepID=UPI0028C4B6B2|nr:uncharacterized protein LOC132384523 [Hypanus sabinus]
MNKMLALADGHKPCLMFEQAFLEQLPGDIHLLLVDTDFSDPRKVAARADVLWKAKRESMVSVGQITRPRAQQQTRPGLAGGRTQHRGRSEEDSEQWCFYHQRWGTEARHCRPPCKGQGQGQLLLMTMAAGHHDSLLYVWDKQSGRCFLVDTGAEISDLPPTGYNTRNRKPEPTQRRFDHIHVDIVGPLPMSRGTRYLLTMVDQFTRWPEAVPLTDTSTDS